MVQRLEPRWLLLIHQIPPKPAYLRVKIGRRLHRIGAVAIKNSVYVLPLSDAASEDFHWVLQEIVSQGGEAYICEASFVDGLSDAEIEGSFRDARKADYDAIAVDIAEVEGATSTRSFDEDARSHIEADLTRLSKRIADISAIDFFGAAEREQVNARIAAIERQLKRTDASDSPASVAQPMRGRVWVTRIGIHVDRMASAWLIRRFIDPDARFKFVAAKGYRPEEGELRFDMFEAEFTHEGDLCTFEVLLARFSLADAALRPIAEMIHDIDLKDAKFARPDTVGFERLIAGIAIAHSDDEVRLARASAVLDDMYAYFDKHERHG